MSFIFYDTETTGTDTAFDQILQFGAIRTDNDFNEIDRFEIRSRLLPHIVPAPGAMRATGISARQLTDLTMPTHYQMMRVIYEKLRSWSPSVFLGYNSIKFDEHLLRQAFYQTLHPLYLTNTGGNARADVLTLVQAVSLYAPGILTIPVNDKKRKVFKLDQVAPANGFAHEHAHDAMGDVEATIHLCRIIKKQASDIWTNFIRFSNKGAVSDYVLTEAVFSLSDSYFGSPYAGLVSAIGMSPNKDSVLVLDLTNDPSELTGLSSEELLIRMKKSPKPVRSVKLNACPTLMPSNMAPVIAMAQSLGSEELQRRAQLLKADSELCERLITTHNLIKEEKEEEPSEYTEKQIYNGKFFSINDQKKLEKFHQISWEERLSLINQLEDERLRVLAQRLIYFERPELLNAVVRQEHDEKFANRLLALETSVPWLTLPKAIAEVESLLESAEANKQAFFKEHREYLLDRLQQAAKLLNAA